MEPAAIIEQGNISESVYIIDPPGKTAFEKAVLQRLENIEQTQKTILLKLTNDSMIDPVLKRSRRNIQSSIVEFLPIDNLESLQNMEKALKDNDIADQIKEKLSIVCGSDKGKGANNCFALVDVMFTRKFLTKCSWSGGSRGDVKTCFKMFTRVIKLFFEIIYQSDNAFTFQECESFFKIILKNSVKRLSAKLMRKSTPRNRRKKVNKTENLIITATDASDQINQLLTESMLAQGT